VSRLPTVSSRELIRYLTSRGFRYERTRGSHHVLVSNAARIVVPERSELGKGLLMAILAEAGISREQFIQDWGNV
jgi:predicted RNA binding protein YcfA (HicA-like mRNA interferase family)